MEMYEAPVDLSQKALVPIDLFLSGERTVHSRKEWSLPMCSSSTTLFLCFYTNTFSVCF